MSKVYTPRAIHEKTQRHESVQTNVSSILLSLLKCENRST